MFVIQQTKLVEEVTGAVESTIDGSRYARELYHLSQMFDLLGQTEQGLKRVEEDLELSHGDVDGFAWLGSITGNRDVFRLRPRCTSKP